MTTNAEKIAAWCDTHPGEAPVAEVPDALIEKAALAADYADDPWPSGDPADWEQGPRADQYRSMARAALFAVYDEIAQAVLDELAVEAECRAADLAYVSTPLRKGYEALAVEVRSYTANRYPTKE